MQLDGGEPADLRGGGVKEGRVILEWGGWGWWASVLFFDILPYVSSPLTQGIGDREGLIEK